MIRNATAQAQFGSGGNDRWIMSRAAAKHGPKYLGPSRAEAEADDIRHRRPTPPEYAVQFAITLIQGKWKIGILFRLQHGPARLSQLRRIFPQASKKMLTQHLRELERDGLIVRTDLSDRLQHIEYSLSDPRGLAVSRLLHILTTWSAEYLARVSKLDENEFSDSGKFDSGSGVRLKDDSHCLEWNLDTAKGISFVGKGRLSRNGPITGFPKDLKALREPSVSPKH